MRSRASTAMALLLVALLLAPTSALGAPEPPSPPKPPAPTTSGPKRPLGMETKSGPPVQQSGPVQVMVELADEPAVVTAAREGGPGRLSASASRSQINKIEQAQQAVVSAMNASGIQNRTLFRVQRAYNGVATVVDASQIAKIETLPGVKGVHVLQPKTLNNFSSVPLINAPAVWTANARTGLGISIGIIDTGVDYIHKNFGGSGNYGLNTSVTAIGDSPDFPRATIVAGGWDFVGNAYNANSSDPAINTPVPDPDPMDCNGHGSHVAGSAAGRGVNDDGTTYTGVYTSVAVPFSTMRIGPGVAPQAKLYALKVFGCTGSTNVVTDAIDWALDPDNNGDLSDHLDVINMSLGSDYGTTNDPDSVASDNAALAGMIVVASAGNSGDTTGVTGSPAASARAISVAASDDAGAYIDGFGVSPSIPSGATVPGNASVAFNWAAMTLPISGQLAYPTTNKTGCTSFTGGDAAAISGKVALLDWAPGGTSPCGSATRVLNAFNANAKGVVFAYHLTPGDFGITGRVEIPAVLTSAANGDALKTLLGGGPVTVTFDKAYLASVQETFAGRIDQIASFTSRGPAGPAGLLKPDLAAPGVSIFSTLTGSGDKGESLSGTSMAAPHVTGMMALLRQQHPTWTVEELKALAMNTANHNLFTGQNQTGTTYATDRVGAGRVDVSTATASDTIVYVMDQPGAVSVSFGLRETLGNSAPTRTIRVVNKGGSSNTYTLGFTQTTSLPGASIGFDGPNDFTLAAGASRDVRVVLTLNAANLRNPRDPTMAASQTLGPRQYLAELTGLITVTQSSGPALRLPVYASARPAADMHATQTNIPVTPATNSLNVNLAGQGVNTGATFPNDLLSQVSIFELGEINPPKPANASDEEKLGDIRYVGVATDGHLSSDPANSWMYFGVGLEQNWTFPMQGYVQIEINIDTDRNGSTDYILYNLVYVPTDGDPLDHYITALYKVSNGSTTLEWHLNGFDGNFNTALFNNNVVHLPVNVGHLGLTTGASRFNYRVFTFANYGVDVADSTGTLTYDWLKPGAAVITSQGANPTADDLPGGVVPITYNYANFQANNSLGLLLLHHFNTFGKRAEVVTLGQTQTVSFAPGSPTAKTLGDAPFTVSASATSTLPVTIASQTPQVCTINGANLVTLAHTGTCTLRASQTGNGVYQPASADLNIVVSSSACLPRPPVNIHTLRLPDGRIRVIVTAGNQNLQSIQFGTDTLLIENATVQIDAQTITTKTTVPMPPNTTQKMFFITRTTAGQKLMVPLIITDGCGAFNTFVAAGTGP